MTAEATGALVHLPRQPETELRDPRLGDVDEWGRSESIRALARRLYDPLYRQLFRVEWQGLEKIPAEGGALLVANHAAAIPSDAPVIMHGIEEELHRPVYGLADHGEYVEKLGDERWRELEPGEAWSDPVNYGKYTSMDPTTVVK